MAMGLFSALNTLLDENSNEFEKKMNKALDRFENTLTAGLDKAEQGAKQADGMANRAVNAIDKVDNVSQTMNKQLSTEKDT